MNPEKNKPTEPFIFPHQRDAFDRLSLLARATIFTNLSDLPIQIRPSVFITGPSGVGKTHIVREVAVSLNLEFYSISLSEWIILGGTSRGATTTWPSLCQFLNTANSGAIIFVDEVDKLRSHGGSSATGGEWSRMLLTELYTLLDFRVPRNLNDENGDQISQAVIANAAQSLRSKTMIVAAGAFHEIWSGQSPIGFASAELPEFVPPDLNLLAQFVPRELINRFGSQLVVLKPLVEGDYHDILASILPRLPVYWRSRFEQLALRRIPEAARQHQGPRFFEELLLDVIVNERAEVSAPLGSAESSVNEFGSDLAVY